MAESKRASVGVIIAILGIGLGIALLFREQPHPLQDDRAAAGPVIRHETAPNALLPEVEAPESPDVAPDRVAEAAEPPTRSATSPVRRPWWLKPAAPPSLPVAYPDRIPSDRSPPPPPAVTSPAPEPAPPVTARPTAPPVVARPVSPPPPPRPRVRRHTIRDGDTLANLAARFLGDARRGGEILATNRDVIVDPQLLPIGELLVIPLDPKRSPAPASSTESRPAVPSRPEATEPTRPSPPASTQPLVPVPRENFRPRPEGRTADAEDDATSRG